MGFLKSSLSMIAAGLRSNTLLTISPISSSDFLPVPKVSTITETGFATPMAYASSTSHLSARPDATIFFATHLDA